MLDTDRRVIIGLDMGTLRERSALVVVEDAPFGTPEERQLWQAVSTNAASAEVESLEDGVSVRRAPSAAERAQAVERLYRRVYTCHPLKTWPPGTEHGEIVGSVGQYLARKPQLSGALLALDVTAVGHSVGEWFRAQLGDAHNIATVLYEVTGGTAVTYAPTSVRVAKRELVSVLTVLLAERRLKVGDGYSLSSAMFAEFGNFNFDRAKTEDQMDWRDSQREHDDLVLAAAIACWHGERNGGWLLA